MNSEKMDTLKAVATALDIDLKGLYMTGRKAAAVAKLKALHAENIRDEEDQVKSIWTEIHALFSHINRNDLRDLESLAASIDELSNLDGEIGKAERTLSEHITLIDSI